MENNLSLAEQWKALQPELLKAFGDSLYMIGVSISWDCFILNKQQITV